MSRLTTGVPPLTVEARDYDSVTLPVDAFEFSPTSKYVGLKTGWSFRTSLLTLSGAASPLYSPVVGEKSLGTLHPLSRTPSGWDGSSNASYTTPATLDLSSLVPVGTTAVHLHVALYYGSTSAHGELEGDIWNYDYGPTRRLWLTIQNGYRIFIPAAAATASGAQQIESQAIVQIGSSRKLYFGVVNTSATLLILVKGYYA